MTPFPPRLSSHHHERQQRQQRDTRAAMDL
jgi:hypothetical protein